MPRSVNHHPVPLTKEPGHAAREGLGSKIISDEGLELVIPAGLDEEGVGSDLAHLTGESLDCPDQRAQEK